MHRLLSGCKKRVWNLHGSIVGTMGLILLVIQNSFLQTIDTVAQFSGRMGKLVALGTASTFFLLAGLQPTQQAASQVVNSTYGPGINTGSMAVWTGSSMCSDIYFCEYLSGAVTVYDFCQPGQPIGAVCTGSIGLTGTCVGICQGTAGGSPVGCTSNGPCSRAAPCIGFVNNPQVVGPIIGTGSGTGTCSMGGCGSLSGTFYTGTLSSSNTGLCNSGYTYYSGSLTATASGRAWRCVSAFRRSILQGTGYGCFVNGTGGNGGGSGNVDCDLTQTGTQGAGDLCNSSLATGFWSVSGNDCTCTPFSCDISLPSTAGLNQSVQATVTVSIYYPLGGAYTLTHAPSQGATQSGTISSSTTYIPLTYTTTGSITSTLVIGPTSTATGLTCTDTISIVEVPSTGTYVCTGTVPTHATLCTGDDQGLVVNLPRQVVSSCSSPVGSYPKCEYKCNTGYAVGSGACVLVSSGSGNSSTGGGSHGGGKKSSISDAFAAMYCGDGKKRSTEACDDGNKKNGDGCDAYCRIERSGYTHGSIQDRLVERLRDSMVTFENSCAYTDINYADIIFEDIERNPDEEAIRTLQAYCIVKGYTYSLNKKYHTEAASSIGEVIKVLVKIDAIDKGVAFDEFGWHTEKMPYKDMLPNAWYTPYVLYAYQQGLLDGIGSRSVFGRGELKALTPITKKEFKVLLGNFGIDPDEFFVLNTPGRYVMRDEMAAIIVHAFHDRLIDYQYFYGNNLKFYRRIAHRLQQEPPGKQEAYLRNVITVLKKRDRDMIGWKYNLHVQGMIEFFQSLLDK